MTAMDDGDYIPPAGSAVGLGFKKPHTPPSGSAAALAFKYIFYHPPAGSKVGLNFSDAYIAPAGNQVGLEFSPSDDPPSKTQYAFSIGLDALSLGAPTAHNAAEILFPGSASSGVQLGAPSIHNRTQVVGGAGSIPPANGYGSPRVWLYTRYLKPGGVDTQAHGTQWASHWLRYVTAVGAGDKTARGTPWISRSPRELAPPGFDAMRLLESHVVGGTRFIEPVGTEMTQWGERIIPEGQTLYPQGFVGEVGTPDVQLHTRYLGAKSFETTPDDLRFPFHYVWNLRQYIRQDYDPNDGLNPQPFGQWTAIENRNKAPVPAGWLSERHGYTSIFNKAVVVLPQGIAAPAEEPFYKAGSITHRVRPLQLDGWDSAEQSRWAAVFNVADPLLPTGVDALGLGRPSIENRSRLYDKVGNFDSMAVGAPMVAERVRELRIEERHTIEPPQIELPEVKLHTRYLEYVSAGDFAGAGMPVLDIRWTVITPRWTFHPPAWIGEPALRNVTPELRTGGANHEEFGTASIRTQWRTVETMYGDMVQWGRPIVRDRRHWVEFVTVGAPPQMMPGPKVTKVGGLPDPQGIQPNGIAPTPSLEEQVPRPVLNLLFAYPEGFDASRHGSAKVTANSIRVEPGIGEYLVGEPGVSLKNRVLDVLDKGIKPLTEVGRPRLSPHTIYAVMEAPEQARQNHLQNDLHYVDHGSNGHYLAGPGRPSVSNQHRWLRASGIGVPDNSTPPPRIFNKQSFIKVDGSKHLRMGWPSIPGLQVVDLDQSGWLSQSFGVTTVKHSPYVGPLYVNAAGFSVAFFGAGTQGEHFNRTLALQGWSALAMGASKPGDTPYTWQGLRVGPLMPTTPKGFNAELFGEAWISHRVRGIEAEGFEAFASEYDYTAFAQRMRVRNAQDGTPPRRFVQQQGHASSRVGAPSTRMGAQYIRPDGNSDQHRKGVTQ